MVTHHYNQVIEYRVLYADNNQVAKLLDPNYKPDEQVQNSPNVSTVNNKVDNFTNNVEGKVNVMWGRAMFMLKVLLVLVIIFSIAGVGASKHKKKTENKEGEKVNGHNHNKLKITFVVLGALYFIKKIFNGKTKE